MAKIVENQVTGSGGLPILTAVGNPEGTKGALAGWDGFSASDYLQGFRLWDTTNLPNAADYRTIVIRWKHKAGAPASSGNDEYLISRPANAPSNYGGVDFYLRSVDLETTYLRGYEDGAVTNRITTTTAGNTRGTEWWSFIKIKDPTGGAPQVEHDVFQDGDALATPSQTSTTTHGVQITWQPTSGDHTIGWSPHDGGTPALDNAEILGIGLYDGIISDADAKDLYDGNVDPAALSGMLTWYAGFSFLLPALPTPPVLTPDTTIDADNDPIEQGVDVGADPTDHLLVFEPDHVGRAARTLLRQYRCAPNLSALVKSLAHGAQVHENEVWGLIVGGTTLDGAKGRALDRWGRVVGERRSGLSDDEYRLMISVRIFANTCRSTWDDLIYIVEQTTAPSVVRASPIYPGGAKIHVGRGAWMTEARRQRIGALVRDVRPAGVALPVIEYVGGHFGFDWDPDALSWSSGVLSRLIYDGLS